MGMGRRFQSPAKRRCDDHPIDYKDIEHLKKYLSPHGQIVSRRRTSYCAKCQRELKQAIKRARHLALLPFVG